jgi:hypothetical protein
MIVFILLGQVPWVLLLAQAGMLYLAWIELRNEPGLSFEVKLWWILLVLLFNVLGYAALWLWVTARRRRRSRAEA